MVKERDNNAINLNVVGDIVVSSSVSSVLIDCFAAQR